MNERVNLNKILKTVQRAGNFGLHFLEKSNLT